MPFEKNAIDQTVAAVVRALTDADRPVILDRRWEGRDTFDARETAQILGLSLWATYRGIKNGEIPAARIGKRIVVPRHALEKKLGA
jgi:excisionase family DNA binding protein